MNPFEYVEADDLIKPDTRTTAQKWLDAEMDKRWANEQGAEQYPILEAIALAVIEENQRLSKAIKCACKGYPEDDTAPTCVAILRVALTPEISDERSEFDGLQSWATGADRVPRRRLRPLQVQAPRS